MVFSKGRNAIALGLGLALSACGSTPARDVDAFIPGDAGLADSGDPGSDAGARCVLSEVACVDESIGTLDLFATPSPAAITEEGATPGEFLTHVDATGGGLSPTLSYVYARFTPTGLERVEISDEAAFASPDWDIAFRRFIIRLNSGVAGPSCVRGARTVPGTTFDALTSVPPDLDYRTEAYFTDTCDLVPDGSGLGSPATALSSFWTYPGCVSMSHVVYVIETRSGAHVALEVVGYYAPAIQEQCDTMGTIAMPSMAGNVRIRWRFLDGA
jgi:hypothetical protein